MFMGNELKMGLGIFFESESTQNCVPHTYLIYNKRWWAFIFFCEIRVTSLWQVHNLSNEVISGSPECLVLVGEATYIVPFLISHQIHGKSFANVLILRKSKDIWPPFVEDGFSYPISACFVCDPFYLAGQFLILQRFTCQFGTTCTPR